MKTLSIGIIALLFSACTPKPEPIHFGLDLCEHCSMAISDPRFASQLVTEKGKNRKFDAIECMLNYLAENSQTTYRFILVSPFDQVQGPTDVNELFFVKSDAIESPMGGHIAAFFAFAEAEKWVRDKGGKNMVWEELQREGL